MAKSAMRDLSYGVFILTASMGDKVNACITNTCIQVATNPTRVAFSVINANYTCDFLKQSQYCSIGIMAKSSSFGIIKNFGLQSGRDVNKFINYQYEKNEKSIAYVSTDCVSTLFLKIVSKTDLGSHTLFVAEVVDEKIYKNEEVLTYAYYYSNIKPKKEEVDKSKKIIAWKCKICGYIYEGEVLPKDYICPLCGHPAEDFEPVYAE